MLLVAGLILSLWLGSLHLNGLYAQETSTSGAPTDHLPTFEDLSRETWEFGLRITAEGPLLGISATVPLALDWPEQTISGESEIKASPAIDFQYNQPTAESRQLSIKIPRMMPGDVIESLVRFELQKRLIIAPKDTTPWQIAKSPDRDLRRFLQPTPFIESRHRRIVAIADELKDETLSAWDQIEKIYQWVRTTIEYEFDPDIRSCLEALDRGRGDCEEMTSLFVAVCRAMGIPARAVTIPEHTYPEFYLVDRNGEGCWFPCQVAGDYQFGSMIETLPVIHKGDSFRLPISRKPERYLKPTLIERSGTRQVKLEWIMRRVDD